MTFGILIPAYNAAKTIGAVLAELQSLYPNIPVVVVDDGSSDNTAEVAEQQGVTVLRQVPNAGKGAALSVGLAHAHAQGWTWCICLDADGQHLPRDVGEFLRGTWSEQVGIVVGARELHPRTMPWPRVCSNRLTTWLLSLQARKPLWDSQCGFRMVRTAAFVQSKMPVVGRFEWESRCLVGIARQGWGIERVGIATVYEGAESHIRPWRDTARFIRLWFSLWFQKQPK